MPEYHFSCGNSTDGPIGFCAVVKADTKEQALEKLRAALPQTIEEVTDEEHGVEYCSIYINPNAVTVQDIDEVIADV